ncbi:hypothetical protein FXF51_40240 [Nonomuraea sp. PA05]|uniref:hypothetical protein n=1 Tax=Nonomuraea sp. PA05 TaxID=2604466 RepID=UPI0011D4897D|nr:hypothetical protein [Nonomuraea sp. PA05]TYB57409.1 hypothetical protein FXF51_40240 [Nonomuraea sp. PA05]
MRNALFGIGALGLLTAPGVLAMGYAHSGPAAITCEMGGTGQLAVQSPSIVLAGTPGTTPFQVRLELGGGGGTGVQSIPAQVSGSVTFSLRPGEQFEDYDNRTAAATASLVVPVQGMAAGDRAFLNGSGNLNDGSWKAVPGTYRLHAENLALSIPGGGTCHVSDIEPVGEFFVQPPATGDGEDPALSLLVAATGRIMMALVIVAIGVFLYANRPQRFRRARKPRTDGPRGPRSEQARAPRRLPEPAGFESQPHLRLFRAFTSIAGGCLLTLGLVVSCVVDRRTTLDDLPALPGRPSLPAPESGRPTAAPFHAGSGQEPPRSPYSRAWPTPPPPPRPPALRDR